MTVSDHHAAWLAVMVEHGWVVEYDDDGHIKSLTSPGGEDAHHASALALYSTGGVDPFIGNK